MRVFIAAEISGPLKEEIARCQKKLATGKCDVRWVEPENLHFTLKFLGEIHDSILDDLFSAVERVVKSAKKFTLSLESVGVFPNSSQPRVIWMGAKEGGENLKTLAKVADDQLALLGFEREKREFTPHLTLGRIKSLTDIAALNEALKKFSGVSFGSEPIDRIFILKSALTPKGPVYTKLKEFNLS